MKNKIISEQKKNYLKFLLLIISIALVLDLLNKNIQRPILEIEGETIYSIGKTTKYSFNDGLSDCIEYKFFVNGKIYKSCEVPDYNVKYEVNKYYKLKYSKSNPEISVLYLNEEIRDTLAIIKAGFKIKNKKQ